MKHRECVMRRYISEKVQDKYVLWVRQTKDVPTEPTVITLDEFKETLLKDRGVRVRDALEVINKRSIVNEQATKRPTL
jgi:hypothetical protein